MVSQNAWLAFCLSLISLLSLSDYKFVNARSNGLLYYCDLSSVHDYGHGSKSGVMTWVQPPRSASFYTIRSGDGAAGSDPKTYIPGAVNTIHIRVLQLDEKFIGLILYATNSSNADGTDFHVGEWKVPVSAQFQFLTNSNSACPSTVTHANANIKPLHTRFYFTAPAGSGTLTFKIMIKQGEQAKGNFYIPAVPLVLSEGPVPQPSANPSILAPPGASCATACAASPSTPYCHYQKTHDIQSSSAFSSLSSGLATCRYPLFSSCSPFAPYDSSATGSNGFCTYRNPSNCSNIDVCKQTSTADSQRLCICSNLQLDASAPGTVSPPITPTNPPTPTFAPTVPPKGANGAFSIRGSSKNNYFFPLFVTGFISLFSDRNNHSHNQFSFRILFMTVVAFILVMANPITCHNYIKSQHRAQRAAVSVPCVAKLTNQPHVQIIPGQEYTVEWSQGHGDYTVGPVYFATVFHSDFNQLAAPNITSIIDDYLAKAPASALLTGSHWQRNHIRSTKDGTVPTYFTNDGLSTTDPLFIPRDPVYDSKSDYHGQTLIQTAFQPQYLANDVRASYTSTLYPWIESASKFNIVFKEHSIYNDQADIARFTVPSYHGPGDYVQYFEWSGYKDCIDINVMSGNTPVANPYGLVASVNNTASFVRLDHCEITNVPQPTTQCRRVDPKTMDVSACIKDCLNSGYCTAVQVVRASNPSITLPFTVNIPTTLFNYTFTNGHPDPNYPCMWPTVHNRTTLGCHTPIGSASYFQCDPALYQPTDYVCYGTVPYRNNDFQVSEDYSTAFEIFDPVFYSTCFFKVSPGGFLNIPPDRVSFPSWLADDQCLSCSYIYSSWSSNLTIVPDWTQAILPAGTNCVSCDPMIAPQ